MAASEQKPVETKSPPAPLPSDTFISTAQSSSLETSQSAGSAQPKDIQPTQNTLAQQKQSERENEERVKKARALLDQQIKNIAKREQIPENMVRMELYLESRMRKLFGSRLDSLQSKLHDTNLRIESVIKNQEAALTRTWVVSENAPEEEQESPEIVEELPSPAAPPEPPVDPDDPFFGTLTLYFLGGA